MEMGLQRSQQTFRRSGSSGLVWDERFISGDLGRASGAAGEEEDQTMGRRQGSGGGSGLRRSRSTGSSGTGLAANGQRWGRGGRSDDVEGGFRAGAVAPAADPPSPDVHGCAFCGILGGCKNKFPGKRSARPRRR